MGVTTDEELTDLVVRWQAGWVSARGYQAMRDGAHSVLVRIGLPGRDVERIALSASPAVYESLARRTATPGAWLSAPSRNRAETQALAHDAGFEVSAPEWLMCRVLADHPTPPAPAGYAVVPTSRGDVHVVEILAADGLAAKGQLAVIGADAVPDRIFTMPAHRRRGLGSVVMGSLAAIAVERGARSGVLVASVDGRLLYERLGWQSAADIVGARWVGNGRIDPPADPLE